MKGSERETEGEGFGLAGKWLQRAGGRPGKVRCRGDKKMKEADFPPAE